LATASQVSLASLKRALSEERLGAYSIAGDRDELDAVARYLWNVHLCCALQPTLHLLEVTFRNNLFVGSRQVVDESTLRFRQVPCWLDANPPLLLHNEAEKVAEAKKALKKARRTLTTGRLVSKLSFGFWVSLCRTPYEKSHLSPL
jgi:hypothetical protein